MLKYEEKTTRQVSRSDLETFMRETFRAPQGFEITESPNNTAYNLEAGFREFNDDEILDCLAYLQRGHIPNHSLGLLMDFLCTMGHIEAGNYVVEVSW